MEAEQTEEQKVAKDLISEAQGLAERLEKANQEYKTLVERAEKIKVNELLGGRSVVEKPKTQEEIDQEKANKLISRFK